MFTHFFAEAAARVGAAIGAAKSGESEAPAAPGMVISLVLIIY